MIIWSGWGLLTLVIAVGMGGLVAALTGSAMGLADHARFTGLPLAVGLLAAAAVNWWAGRRLNARPGRELVDPTTGETVVLRQRHSLFFVPMEWWSVVLLLAAAAAAYAALVRPPATTKGFDSAPATTTPRT